jgi:diaminopropionate ammonia-lyase
MFFNPHRTPYQPSDRALIRRQHAVETRNVLAGCAVYSPTPLVPLAGLATEFGVGQVYLKAEWQRMGLPSFKALGGIYAMALLLLRRAEAEWGEPGVPEALLCARMRKVAERVTAICASAGNHGMAVAMGARLFGAQAMVCLSEGVSDYFARSLREQGATVLRAGVTYEDSMAFAAEEAKRRGWELISDCASPDDSTVPLDVMRGYTLLLDEAATAMECDGGAATHVFVQAGVGGLAAAAAGYLRDRWGEGFTLVIVEPHAAACVAQSIREGRCVRVRGGTTQLGRLDCKAPSSLAFELLHHLADACVTVSDEECDAAARRLALAGCPVSACAAAGVAGFISLCQQASLRQRLGLRMDSRTLFIGTEAAHQDIHA